jgi:2-polyprenyl-3-methyl-5-hydroxy-6-metoxy-1,4-benzoquinol methylase
MKCKVCKSDILTLYKGLYDDRHGYPGKFSVGRCQNCGFIETDPQIPARKLSFLYTNFYPKRDANIGGTVKLSKKLPTKQQIFLNGLGNTCHYQAKKGDRVLDIGCGSCLSLLEIKRLGGEPWGIDPDKNSEKVAKKLHLKFHLGTIHNCKFPKKYFDLITASQVLEHEPDPINFLKTSEKFLKPGGKIILSFPNTGSFLRKIWGRKWLHWHIPYHLNHFNRKSIILLTKKSDLKISGIKTVTPNIWTILQIRSFLYKTKEGVRNPMWDESKTHGGGTNKSEVQLMKIISKIIENLLVINRIADFLGQGESFVVKLTPKTSYAD